MPPAEGVTTTIKSSLIPAIVLSFPSYNSISSYPPPFRKQIRRAIASTKMSETKKITMEQLKEHNSHDDLWLLIDGKGAFQFHLGNSLAR